MLRTNHWKSHRQAAQPCGCAGAVADRFDVARRRPRHTRSESGQTLIYFMGVMGMLVLMTLWIYDYNTAAVSRIRGQNGADSAALAAAQWQARSLNAVGELNLVKAINNLLDQVPPGSELQASVQSAQTQGEKYAAIQTALDNLQAEISFVGPMLAMIASQQAAKNNGIPVNPEFTSDVRQHADLVNTAYRDNFTAPGWSDPNWTDRYARMLNYVADEGVAVAPDNASYYYGQLSAGPEASRWLLNKGFYQAISIRNWCYLRDLLNGGYQDFTYWGEIVPLPQSTSGCEYYGLGIEFTSSETLVQQGGLSDTQFEQLRGYYTAQLSQRNQGLHSDWPQFVPTIQWSVFSASWGSWSKAAYYGAALVAEPRPVYDYSGCDAVTAVSLRNNLALALTNRGSGWTSWLVGSGNQNALAGSVGRIEGLNDSSDLSVKAGAAAKPFGQLPGIAEPACTFRVILPAFEEVRLIPIALASAYGNSDAAWLIHRLEHLPFNGGADTVAYTRFGPSSLPGDCFYCSQLRTWEDSGFRQEGAAWLTATDPDTGVLLHDCTPPPSRGGGGGGGGGGAPGVPFAH